VEKDRIHEDLASIRNMMERSSRFISLSGLSGIMAGIYALAGAVYAYFKIYNMHAIRAESSYKLADPTGTKEHVAELITVALIVLVLSIGTGTLLTVRKAKRAGQKIMGKSSKALIFNMLLPLLTGGALILIFISRGYIGIVVPSCLIFYGLALAGASHYTFTDVKYLGIMEIILGIIAALYTGYGLIFWSIGFGLLHIIYGSVMYLKYDK